MYSSAPPPPSLVGGSSTAPDRLPPRLAVCFTGGKDSTLVVHLLLHAPHLLSTVLAIDAHPSSSPASPPPGFPLPCTPTMTTTTTAPHDAMVPHLVTFHDTLAASRDFLSHPVHAIRRQAQAMGLPHQVVAVAGPDYVGSYVAAVVALDVDVLVTGDLVDADRGFMANVCNRAGVRLWCPLWGADRHVVWDLVHELRIVPVLTCVHVPRIVHAWSAVEDEEAGGRRCSPLPPNALGPPPNADGNGDDPAPNDNENRGASPAASAAALARAYERVGHVLDRATVRAWLVPAVEADGLDLGGENGEYHTMVRSAPLFRHGAVTLVGQVRSVGVQGNEYVYLDVDHDAPEM
ncbi:hypothetical protein GGF31_004888 [Allomyces arbusculus]|nr:hypothetical protein GGF31_004888 [Allomyces arbusculus]